MTAGDTFTRKNALQVLDGLIYYLFIPPPHFTPPPAPAVRLARGRDREGRQSAELLCAEALQKLPLRHKPLVQPRRAGWGTGFRRYRQAASSCQRPFESLLLPAPLFPEQTKRNNGALAGRTLPLRVFRRLQTGWQSESAVCVFAAFKKPPDCRHSRAGGNLGAGQSSILLSERFRTPKRFPSARE